MKPAEIEGHLKRYMNKQYISDIKVTVVGKTVDICFYDADKKHVSHNPFSVDKLETFDADDCLVLACKIANRVMLDKKERKDKSLIVIPDGDFGRTIPIRKEEK